MALLPAGILQSDSLDTVHFACKRPDLGTHGQHGRHHLFRKTMIALGSITAGNLQVNVFVFVDIQQRLKNRPPFIDTFLQFQTNFPQTVIESVDMIFQAEQTPSISRNHFVNPVAKQETPVQYRNFGVRQRQVMPVQIHGIGHYFSNITTTASYKRRKNPPSATLSMATKGLDKMVSPASVTFSVPTVSPLLMGASTALST